LARSCFKDMNKICSASIVLPWSGVMLMRLIMPAHSFFSFNTFLSKWF